MGLISRSETLVATNSRAGGLTTHVPERISTEPQERVVEVCCVVVMGREEKGTARNTYSLITSASWLVSTLKLP